MILTFADCSGLCINKSIFMTSTLKPCQYIVWFKVIYVYAVHFCSYAATKYKCKYSSLADAICHKMLTNGNWQHM